MVLGRLHVTVVGGRKLRDQDFFGKMDPYCILRVGNQIDRTRVAKSGGRNPMWNQSFAFDVTDATNPMITIEVKDEDVGKDDFVGEMSLNFGEMAAQNRTVDGWFPVYRDRRRKEAGEIQLKMNFVHGKPGGAHAPAPYGQHPVAHASVSVAGYAPAPAYPPAYGYGAPPPPAPSPYATYGAPSAYAPPQAAYPPQYPPAANPYATASPYQTAAPGYPPAPYSNNPSPYATAPPTYGGYPPPPAQYGAPPPPPAQYGAQPPPAQYGAQPQVR